VEEFEFVVGSAEEFVVVPNQEEFVVGGGGVEVKGHHPPLLVTPFVLR
jgi:hypothetical protein